MNKLFIAVCVMLFTGFVNAQTKEEIKIWEKYATPGEMHKILSLQDGVWVTYTTLWMSPDAKPMEIKGYVKNEMILGDRYQSSVFKADMMGMPFEGRSTVGFDNSTETFKSVWIDNSGTGIMVTEGKLDPKKMVLQMHGTTVDPITGKEIKVREEMYFESEKSHRLEMYMNYGDKEFKSMEVVYTKLDDKEAEKYMKEFDQK